VPVALLQHIRTNTGASAAAADATNTYIYTHIHIGICEKRPENETFPCVCVYKNI